MKKQKAVAF